MRIRSSFRGESDMNRFLETVRPRVWVVIFTGLIVAFTALFVTGRQFLTSREQTIAAMTDQLAELKQTTYDLQTRLDYTYTDEYIERQARGKLGLIYEDEILFQTNGISEVAPD